MILNEIQIMESLKMFTVQMELEPIFLLVDPLVANFPFENLHVFKPLIENDQRSHFKESNN
jgi:hypothetical protein